MYEILVSNIGSVYTGGEKVKAESIYKEYVAQSKSNVGRAGGEDVTMLEKYGSKEWEIKKEFFGALRKGLD